MKKRLLCPALPSLHHPALLSEEEAHHATRVLRLRDGDVVEALDGKGNRAFTQLRTRGGPTRIEYLAPKSKETVSSQSQRSLPLTLEVGVLKGNAMEWVIEKAVELGVEQLTPVLTEYTVVQIDAKGPTFYQERWQKIADQALKQCGRATRMTIAPPVSFESLILGPGESRESKKSKPNSIRLWCDEKSGDDAPYLLKWLQDNAPLRCEVSILIGPEGGWSPTERSMLSNKELLHSTQCINLGPMILRAETAAIFTTSLVSAYLHQK